MNAQDILAELAPLGSPGYKKVMLQHGVREPFFGVKIEDLKKVQKRIKVDYQLALDLYATGNSDAMYLAGLIADDARMSREDLQRWVDGAYCAMHFEYTVPWVATGNPLGRELALEWIESDRENVAAAGWATLGSLVSVKPDAELDLAELERLLERVRDTIHDQPNRVRYVMNGFVIGVGCYVPALTAKAREVAADLGEVRVDMGGTSCKVPDALDYIAKVEARGTLGKKRKTAKC
ncbi:MAG TPA: DNA alkylation repair protein [Thermoanaerobaculia bacterium]|nr:DNA alkylation repair protein [Thermoanaerobaculia bacterium]